MVGLPAPPLSPTDEMAQMIAEVARTSDAAHWPEAVARALIAAGYEKVSK